MAAKSSLISRGLGLVLVEFEYEYEGRDGELVSIKPNERYVLLAKTNDHWWQVQNDHSSKPFYIPANYVKELPGNFPCPLDFAEPPCPKPVPHPVVAPVPVPVPVPVPKPLEEPRSKPGDEVTIRLRPDASTMFHKKENRMSTFGFPLDLQDKAAQVPSSRHSSNLPAGSAEAGSTVSSRTANMADMRKQPPLEDHRDSEKPRVPSFSPADPQSISRPQPIPVEMPVVPPHNNLRNMSLSPKDCHDNQEIPTKSENEEEEMVEEDMSIEESSEEEETQREEDSNHIYESIQDLHLDLDTLVGGNQCPGPPPESAPAPPPPLPTTKENCSLGPNLPIYANISLKKSQISVSGLPCSAPSDPASSLSGHTLSTSPSSSMISSASPLSPQDGWQVHTDRSSGNVFYYHPATHQTTWSDPRSPRDLDLPGPPSPASPQDSVWEQLLDQDTGRIYYHNPKTGATSWTLPDHLSPPSSPGSRRPDNSPPPLPAEDYPMDPHEEDTVFMVGPAPRAELDPKDLDQQRKEQEQRLLGNGVSEEGAAPQFQILRHSIAEDTFSPGHRRTGSDITDGTSKRQSPDGPQFSNRFRLRRNLSNQSTGSHRQHGHPLEKAGVVNKTKVVDNGKKIRKNWTQSWTVLHDGILTFHKDPKFALTGNAIVPEYTVELRGGSVCRASKDKSSKKNVLELRTRQGCEYLIQNDTDSIISDWLKAIQDTIRQLDQENLSEEDDEAAHSSSSGLESEHRQVRSKLRRFLQRRPTLQSVKERGYIRDNVFGCHLDTLCHRENTTIPKFVEKCIRTVERRGLNVDGIYRVSGNLAVIQKLRHKADHEEQLDLEDGAWEEIHVITGALKLFFRELPEPLFPFSCFEKFIAAIQVPDYNLRVSYMKDLVRSLPLPNHNTMELLFKHLRRVIEHKESNRMSVQSVAIVFGPTLLRPQTESANMTVHMVFQSQIVELMLKEFQTVFSEN